MIVSAITPPEEVQKMIDERAGMGAIGDMQATCSSRPLSPCRTPPSSRVELLVRAWDLAWESAMDRSWPATVERAGSARGRPGADDSVSEVRNRKSRRDEVLLKLRRGPAVEASGYGGMPKLPSTGTGWNEVLFQLRPVDAADGL